MNLKDLYRGIKRFHQSYFIQDRHLYENLRTGQAPKVLVISCCDSRVDPALLTQSQPGDIFVIRNVANLVPRFEVDSGQHGVSAAIEFAVKNLEVEMVVILGHSQCGGIRALMQPRRNDETVFIDKWMSISDSARVKVLSENPNLAQRDLERLCEKESILVSMYNLENFPFVKQKIDAGTLKLHGWWFDLESGALEVFSPQRGHWAELSLGPK